MHPDRQSEGTGLATALATLNVLKARSAVWRPGRSPAPVDRGTGCLRVDPAVTMSVTNMVAEVINAVASPEQKADILPKTGGRNLRRAHSSV